MVSGWDRHSGPGNDYTGKPPTWRQAFWLVVAAVLFYGGYVALSFL